MSKAKKKHRAQITIDMKIFDVLPDESISGTPMSPEDMKNYGLTPRQLVEIEGFDQFETCKKVKEKIDGLRK